MKTNLNYDSFGNPYSESVSSNNVTKTVSRRMTDAKTYQFTYPDGKTVRKTATGNDLDSIEYNNSEIASYSRANGVRLYPKKVNTKVSILGKNRIKPFP